MGQPNSPRAIVVWLLACGLFAFCLYTYIRRSIPTRAQLLAEQSAAMAPMEHRGPSMLDSAAGVAEPFVEAIGGGRFAEAHTLLAAPYRDAVSVEAFARKCRASPILAGARSVTFQELRSRNAGSATTFEAQGLLDSRVGAVPVGFVFLREGGVLRILVVSLAGVPVLQGIAP
jgi:hypothetical protein